MAMSRRLRILPPLVAALACLFLAVATSPARAAHTFPAGSPFTGGTDLITNFPASSFGPIGLLNDGSHIFVTDLNNTTTYRFPLTGGNASSPEAQAANGLGAGIALSNGTYFGLTGAGSPLPAGLYSFDPTTLALGAGQPPPLATWPGNPLAVVADPLTTDLYVTTGGIFRIQNPTSGAPIVTQFASSYWDGLYFTANGALLFGARSDQHVVGFNRSGTVVFDVNLSPHGPDGLAIASSNTVVQTSSGPLDISNNIFVNSNDGTIERIDVNNGNTVSIAAQGGTRGDFATVGPDGCLYVTQTDLIEKLAPCFFSNTYVRPKGANRVRVPLVPGYVGCTAANRTHGPPLAGPSCWPPTDRSGSVTVGSPDANGAAANSVGSLRFDVKVGVPGPPEDSDVKITSSITDVRCKAGTAACGAANAVDGSDYTGELANDLTLRITDKANGSSGTDAATVVDFPFRVPMTCGATTSTSIGGTCALVTTANTVIPAMLKDGKRAIWELGQAQVYDGGADGTAGTNPNTLFMVQGIFVP